MNCTDCKGSGKYQPFFGPAEDCLRCDGDGQEPIPEDELPVPGIWTATHSLNAPLTLKKIDHTIKTFTYECDPEPLNDAVAWRAFEDWVNKTFRDRGAE